MEESHPSQLIAVFLRESDALDVARRITQECHLLPKQVRIFPPRQRGTTRLQLLRIGFGCGVLGGLLAAVLALATGDSRALEQPGQTVVVLAILGAIVGMAFASIMSWRPSLIRRLGSTRLLLESNSFLMLVDMHDIAQQMAVRDALARCQNIPYRITDSGFCTPDSIDLPESR